MARYNAELLVVIEADDDEGADQIAEEVRETVVSTLHDAGVVVDASVEVVVERRRS